MEQDISIPLNFFPPKPYETIDYKVQDYPFDGWHQKDFKSLKNCLRSLDFAIKNFRLVGIDYFHQIEEQYYGRIVRYYEESLEYYFQIQHFPNIISSDFEQLVDGTIAITKFYNTVLIDHLYLERIRFISIYPLTFPH